MKIEKADPLPGAAMRQWNISVGGKPFGAIWTYRNTRTETYPFTLKLISDDKARHYDTYDEATKAAHEELS